MWRTHIESRLGPGGRGECAQISLPTLVDWAKFDSGVVFIRVTNLCFGKGGLQVGIKLHYFLYMFRLPMRVSTNVFILFMSTILSWVEEDRVDEGRLGLGLP